MNLGQVHMKNDLNITDLAKMEEQIMDENISGIGG